MKYFIFAFTSVFSLSSLAYNYRNEMTCLEDLSGQLDNRRYHSMNDGNTMLYMLKESLIPGILSRENSEGFFLFEEGKVQFCAFDWSTGRHPLRLKLNDANSTTLQYTDAYPYFRDPAFVSFYYPTRRCEDVSGNARANEMLKLIVLEGLRERKNRNQGVLQVPVSCRRTTNFTITQSDFDQLLRDGSSEATSSSPVDQ